MGGKAIEMENIFVEIKQPFNERMRHMAQIALLRREFMC